MKPATQQIDRPDTAEKALLALLVRLKQAGYRFVTPTPATHARVVARSSRRVGRNLRDALGWSLPFEARVLDPGLLDLLHAAEALVPEPEGRLRSRYRVSSLGTDLFLHSAYPTDEEDAVFFGPDSYRFADLVRGELDRRPPRAGARFVDIGAGAGVGAIVAARLCVGLQVTMTDINPQALHLGRINAAAAGIEARCALGANLDPVEDPVDLALANPPYLLDAAGRDYRDGGDMHGGRVAYEMAVAAAGRLAPDGRFILYTGSAIVDGQDALRAALTRLSAEHGLTLRYREIDPDVFGEELEQPGYEDVERIAIVGAVLTAPPA